LQSRQNVALEVPIADLAFRISVRSLPLYHHDFLAIRATIIDRDRREAAVPAAAVEQARTGIRTEYLARIRQTILLLGL
jgi:hypothetical protein